MTIRRNIFCVFASIWVVGALFAACPIGAKEAGDRIVILVRHAEKQKSDDRDPELSAAGDKRAQALRDVLKDTRIDCIITSQYKRTKNTSRFVAQAHDVTPTVVGTDGGLDTHLSATAAAVRERPAGETILVVGHSNTVPGIIKALGGPTMDDLTEYEYESLFILRLPLKGDPTLIRARYGAPNPAASPLR